MTPKEKAHDLFEKMAHHLCNTDAQECAIIAVDEMLGMLPFPEDEWHLEMESFLSEVKQEIENL